MPGQRENSVTVTTNAPIPSNASRNGDPFPPTVTLASHDLLALLLQDHSMVWGADAEGLLIHLCGSGTWAAPICEPEMTGQHWLTLVHCDDRKAAELSWTRARAALGHCTFKARLEGATAPPKWHEFRAMAVLDDEGVLRSWIGSARDIEAEVQTRRKLEKAEETLRALECCSEGLLYTKDRDGRLTWCNDAVVEVLGRDRDQILGRLAQEYMRGAEDAAHVAQHDHQVISDGRTLLVEEVLQNPRRVYLSSKAPWRGSDGRIRGLVGLSLNITNEQRLRSQWAPDFERLHQTAPIIVSRFDSTLKHTSVSQGIEAVTGMPATSFLGKTNRELGMPSHLCDQWDAAMRAVLMDRVPRDIEFTYTGPDNKPRIFRSLLSADTSPSGGDATLIAIAYEVTEFKAQQAQIREREARLAAALSAAKMQPWSYLIGEDLFLVPPSPGRHEVIRGDSDRVRWVDAFTSIHRDDVDRVQKSLRRCAHEQIDYDETYRVRDAEGNWRWVRAAGRYVPHDPSEGSAPQIAGVLFDLTEERQAQHRLKESEESLRLAIDAVDAGRYDWDLATGELRWVDRTRALFHLPTHLAPSYEYFLSKLHPDDRVRLAARVGMQLDGSQSDGLWCERYRVMQPDGSLRWLESQGRVSFEEGSGQRRPLRFIGLVTDVTERVETLERLAASEGALRSSLNALAESEERLRLAMESSSLGWWDMDVASTRIVWSASARHLFDMPREGEVRLEEVLIRVAPEDLPRVQEAIEAAMSPCADGTFHESYRVLWRDGTKREVEAIGRVRFASLESGRTATRFTGVLWDVTEERCTWRTLQDKKAYLAALVQTAPVGILSVDERGLITRSNPLMVELFGPLALGEDVHLLAEHWESHLEDGTRIATDQYPILQALSGTFRAEVEVRHRPSGSLHQLWLRLIASPVIQHGRSVGAVMACIDIDAERRAVEVLKEADARKEQFFAILAHEI